MRIADLQPWPVGDAAIPHKPTQTGFIAPGFVSPRLRREWKTMAAMIRTHCRCKHGGSSLCQDCEELLNYATTRLDRCRFGAAKPTCANCPVHCYQPSRREQIRVVMRFAGPRMLWQHPILSLWHWLDGFRKAPVRACR
jgi:hypothetical protein